MDERAHREGCRRAFTLIEVLVVIVVISTLVALLIPAVQQARSAARAAHCASNLRQLGLSAANYESSVGSFPMAVNGARGFSIFSMLLFVNEQQPLYHSINFSLPYFDPANSTASNTTVSALWCPADSRDQGFHAGTNYAGNVGYGYQLDIPANGVFSIKPLVTPKAADVVDGLSNTALFAEWACGAFHFKNVMIRNTYRVPEASKPSQFEAFNTLCLNAPVQSGVSILPHKGLQWIATSLGNSLYNHNLPPGSPSCLNGSWVREGCWSASSFHGNGANVLFGDGHATWVSASIDRSVWRAMGTKAGGELITQSAR